MSLAHDLEFAKEIKLPFNRFGGEAKTRYNRKIDVTDHAVDWFFENIPNENAHPEKLPDGSEFDRFTGNSTLVGAKTILTVPLIGWTPKDRVLGCSFSVKKYGAQQKTHKWMPECGNGKRTNGILITGNDPTDTSMKVNVSFAEEWVQYLIKKCKVASNGGVLFYQLDNEQDIWHEIHYDVRPKPARGDEFINLSEEYDAAIKGVDSSANLLGPVGYGFMSLLRSGE